MHLLKLILKLFTIAIFVEWKNCCICGV